MSAKVKTRTDVEAAWPYCKATSRYHDREVWCVLKPGHDGWHRAETLDWVEAAWPEGDAEAIREECSTLSRCR